MRKDRVDVVLVNPGNRRQIYQSLGDSLNAIEPPLWIGLIATYLRNHGCSVVVLDSEAHDWSPEVTARHVEALSPQLTCVIVFGSQPSASTQKMSGARDICAAVRAIDPTLKTLLGGVHVSALPERTLREEPVDFVCEGEGPITILRLAEALRDGRDVATAGIPGLWFWQDGVVRHTPQAPLIDPLDRELPGVAWDLLPMDLYRAHNWHCFGRLEARQPYAVIYTTLGCPFKCSFCCINAPFGGPSYRYRSPENVVQEIELLVTRYGVQNIKIIDEMFVLKPGHVLKICDLIIERGLDLNIWAYARVDTVRDNMLDKLKRAGVNWLALGIESASTYVRDGVDKGFTQDRIKTTVENIRRAGIYVIGNYIFGLPDDDMASMQATLDMAMELNCEMANFYCAMAYPGSKLYGMAVEKRWALPEQWHGFSQHSVDTLPLPTQHLAAGEVLRFRDEAFHTYFSNPSYLAMITKTFGAGTAQHIREMSQHRLERKLLSAAGN